MTGQIPIMRIGPTLLTTVHVELRDAVAQGVDPERRDRVEVRVAVGVVDVVTVGAVDDDGRVLRVRAHLGEAVPDGGGVAFDPTPSVGHACHDARPMRTRGESRGT